MVSWHEKRNDEGWYWGWMTLKGAKFEEKNIKIKVIVKKYAFNNCDLKPASALTLNIKMLTGR